MITRAQVADLRAGDVVEVTDDYLCTSRGPLREAGPGALLLGRLTVLRYPDGGTARPTWSLTVVSRAPRPLYVNHDRTEPVRGDIVKDADGGTQVWLCDESRDWWSPADGTVRRWEQPYLPKRLRLLIDGATGEVVRDA